MTYYNVHFSASTSIMIEATSVRDAFSKTRRQLDPDVDWDMDECEEIDKETFLDNQ